jgi:hypothetical protein
VGSLLEQRQKDWDEEASHLQLGFQIWAEAISDTCEEEPDIPDEA